MFFIRTLKPYSVFLYTFFAIYQRSINDTFQFNLHVQVSHTFCFQFEKKNIYNMQIAVVKVFLNELCEMCWCLQYCSRLHRVTMDEAKEVHTTLRTAAGIFKFVKVLVVVVVVLKWFVLNSC